MCEVEQGCPVCGETTPEVHEALFHGIVETPIGMPCCGTSRLSARVVAHARQQRVADHQVAAMAEQRDAAREEARRLRTYVDGISEVLTELSQRLLRHSKSTGEAWNDPDSYGRDEHEPMALEEVLPRPVTDAAFVTLVDRVWQAVAVDRPGGAITIGRDQVQRILYALNRMWN